MHSEKVFISRISSCQSQIEIFGKKISVRKQTMQRFLLRVAGGLRKVRIEWCDRHLCHVIGSDHTNIFGVKQHLECGSIQARTVDNGPENVFRHHLH